MRRLVVLALGLLAFSAAGQSALFLYESQALTRAAPTLTSEGMSLSGVKAVRISVCAESGQTLSGTGNIRIYFLHGAAGLWHRNPGADLTVTATTRCQVFGDLTVAAVAVDNGDRVLAATDTLGVSGGTTATVRMDGSRR